MPRAEKGSEQFYVPAEIDACEEKPPPTREDSMQDSDSRHHEDASPKSELFEALRGCDVHGQQWARGLREGDVDRDEACPGPVHLSRRVHSCHA